MTTGFQLPIQEIQGLDGGDLVSLFILDTTMLGGDIQYLTPSVNDYGVGVIWQNMAGATTTYSKFPIAMEGVDRNAKGAQARPSLMVSNISPLIGQLVKTYNDLCGATVIRRRVAARYLDSANFNRVTAVGQVANGSGMTFTLAYSGFSLSSADSPTLTTLYKNGVPLSSGTEYTLSGAVVTLTTSATAGTITWDGNTFYNPTANRAVRYADDEFTIEQRASETPAAFVFSLASSLDAQGIMIPGRVVQRHLCTLEYQGLDELTACPFAGPFTGANTTCAKTDTACKAKFPNLPLPFSGFTGARRA